ncbi:MAG: ribokinase [Fimbriimonadales bacterium]|nr:MAG: ribokinase [Fimbriimonadales bacterium]
MNQQILCVGSIAFDCIMEFPGDFREHLLVEHLDRLSVSFLVDEMRREHGGVAANIAYTIALLGGSPILCGTVGRDFGNASDRLERLGVDTSGILTIEDKYTASFFVSTDDGNRQIAMFYAGAMADADKISLHELDLDEVALAVVSPTAPAAMAKAVRECKELGLPYVYDPSQQIVRLTAEDLLEGIRGSLMLIVNDYELGLIEKKTGLESAEIRSLTQALVVTRGEKGVSVMGTDVVQVKAVPAREEVDPTGIGDAFRGGFLAAYVRGADWRTAAEVGALAATYCLETMGTQNHEFTLEEFLLRGEEAYGNRERVERFLGQPSATPSK